MSRASYKLFNATWRTRFALNNNSPTCRRRNDDQTRVDKNKLSSSEWMVVEACERAGVLDKGHLVAVDNFYASPKLFAEMVKRDTDMVCSLCPADTY